MARRASAPATHQKLLDHLATTFGDRLKRHPLPEHRAEAVAAARAGVPLTAIAKAIGMSDWTVSRWVKASPPPPSSPPPPAVRELTLVATPRPIDAVDDRAAQIATLKLPGGIQLDVPVAALTASFIGQLLAAGGVP